EVRVLYDVISAGFKIPHIKKAHVRLVSKNYTFKESDDIKAPYVISISDPAHKRNTITVPLNTSKNSIRRLKQYGCCHSAEFSMREDGQIRVSIAFKKKLKQPKTATYNGVDVGIVDALHSEHHGAIGSMSSTIMFYKNTVEPSFGELSKIRNKKQKIKRFLRKHKNLPDDVRNRLRKKIDRLETMLRRTKKAYRQNRHYYNMLGHEIKAAVDGYIDKLNEDKSIVTVLELFDVKEFYKSHKENGIYSMNARGQLTQKLMEQLNWHGFSFIEVESAYTSQACPVCFCIDPENRKRKTFLCTCCGHKDDADHNATINISMRAEDDEVLAVCEKHKYSKRDRHKSIKSIFEKRNAAWLAAQPA
ncbi:MAG: zinc ribbon domain-containing protein, partial [Eubacteriales bacterium]|nr:zinc ribbon domain-containing protein [Eubacteriales bacterium]